MPTCIVVPATKNDIKVVLDQEKVGNPWVRPLISTLRRGIKLTLNSKIQIYGPLEQRKNKIERKRYERLRG